MHPLERADNLPQEFSSHLAEQQRHMQEARSLVSYAHSRTGLLARFLQALADRVDPRRGTR
jgi:hypothetical protein